MKRIRIAIAGVGNCATRSSRHPPLPHRPSRFCPGPHALEPGRLRARHWRLPRPRHRRPQGGRDVAEAIFAPPNCNARSARPSALRRHRGHGLGPGRIGPRTSAPTPSTAPSCPPPRPNRPRSVRILRQSGASMLSTTCPGGRRPPPASTPNAAVGRLALSPACRRSSSATRPGPPLPRRGLPRSRRHQCPARGHRRAPRPHRPVPQRGFPWTAPTTQHRRNTDSTTC